jgi:hypothetical protein
MRLPLPAWFVVLFVLPACSFEASCGGGIDMKKVEPLVSEWFAKAQAKVTGVKCPEKVKKGAGETFECTVSVEGTSFEPTILVTQKDDKGAVNVKLVGAHLTATIEAIVTEQFSEQTKTKMTVDCGARVQKIEKGGIVDCSATDGKATLKVAVTFTDDAGSISWAVVGK